MAHDDVEVAPLAGIRVLDLSRVLAGPLCTMVLGDLGADVVKVERPGTGDETRQWGPPWVGAESGRESTYYLSVNRNKRSITADLTSAAGRGLVAALMGRADVVVENFLPGRLEAWGLGYEEIARRNPGLIFCSITGYPGEGERASRPGYDFAVQAESGWMAITGEPGGEPTKVGVAVVDVLTGQNAAIAILAALHERTRSGLGQRVRVTLFHSALAGLVNVLQSTLAGAESRRYGNAHPNIVPYQAFRAADGQIVIAVGNDEQWRRLCSALRAPELEADPRFATNPDRVEHREILVPLLANRLVQRRAEEWLREISAAGVPCAPVREVAEAVSQARAANIDFWAMRVGPEPVETMSSPLGLSRTPPRLSLPAPSLGEHDEMVPHLWRRPAPEK